MAVGGQAVIARAAAPRCGGSTACRVLAKLTCHGFGALSRT
jgi:hypothetical protein